MATSLRLFGPPFHHLDEPLGEFFSDRDAIGYSNKVGILEFHARPFIAVVQHRIETSRLTLFVTTSSAASR